MATNSNYIYLIHEREFIKTGEPIYKLGKTTQQGLSRLYQYPKGSDLILHIKCVDCHKSEKDLLEIFNKKYKLRKDIGTEYFEGDEVLMVNDIIQYIQMEKINDASNKITEKYLKIKVKLSEINYNISRDIDAPLIVKEIATGKEIDIID